MTTNRPCSPVSSSEEEEEEEVPDAPRGRNENFGTEGLVE